MIPVLLGIGDAINSEQIRCSRQYSHAFPLTFPAAQPRCGHIVGPTAPLTQRGELSGDAGGVIDIHAISGGDRRAHQSGGYHVLVVFQTIRSPIFGEPWVDAFRPDGLVIVEA